MNTRMMSTRGRGARWAAVGIGSLLAAAGLASRASAEHGLLEQVSTGPTGGNGALEANFAGLSADGTRIFFTTRESLESADTDMFVDVYERSGGQTSLLSTGPFGGNGPSDATFAGTSDDGSRVFFVTGERLVSADANTTTDVYERSGGQTTLVSTGRVSTGADFPVFFRGASADGGRVFYTTKARGVLADTDWEFDVYESSGGQTTLVSTGPFGGNGAFPALVAGVSEDGGRVFFRTVEQLRSTDTDATEDVYERSGGQTTLVSTGPTGGNGTAGASFVGASADGTRVFFTTLESLVSTDTETSGDVYERSGGETTLLSTGPTGGNGTAGASFVGGSADGTRVFFQTLESMVSADIDATEDVYERSGGQTTLVSTGPTGGNGTFDGLFRGASADGFRVFFETAERLVSADTDIVLDLYERAGGQTTLVSTGPAGGNGPFDALFRGASADGSRVFFVTRESLASADTDGGSDDVYERAGGLTTLISSGPTAGNGTFDALFRGASADGSRVFFTTVEALVSTDTDTSEDIYVKRIVAPVNTARPTISGTPLVGRRLSCSQGSWDHVPTTFVYRWSRAGAAITGATSSTYTLTAADGARPVTCTVTASNSAGSGSATSSSVTPRFPGACANLQTGGAGPDRLTGLALGDTLRGLGGNDVLTGLAGADCLSGGTGNDRLTGGPGKDSFDAGAGDDTINSRDNVRETVTCGTGPRDRVTADRIDRLVGCEIVRRG